MCPLSQHSFTGGISKEYSNAPDLFGLGIIA
jgi:hypothetical protein